MQSKINDEETVRDYVHRLITEAFNEVIEDVDVEVTDELGIYRDYEDRGEKNEFMTAYPYRSLKITINFFDKTINLKKVE
jgi:hypothetical protein